MFQVEGVGFSAEGPGFRVLRVWDLGLCFGVGSGSCRFEQLHEEDENTGTSIKSSNT